MTRRSTRLALAATLLPLGAAAQPVAPPPLVHSLGQPRDWRPYVSGMYYPNHPEVLSGTLGLERSIGSPVNGVLGYGGEAYVTGGDGIGGGVRALARSNALNLAAGLDWDFREGAVGFTAGFTTSIRRGGLVGRGTALRVDWTTVRGGIFGFGLTVPLMQPTAGRTRPRQTGVWLDSVAKATRAASARAIPAGAARAIPRVADPEDAEPALAAVREAAGLLRLYTNFFSDRHESGREADVANTRKIAARVRDSLAVRSPRYPEGRSYAAVQRAYQSALAEAFGVAVADSATGTRVARRARAGLLATVILPYDAQLGRVKNRQQDLGPLFALAADDFSAWLRDSSGVVPAAAARARAVHRRWLAIVSEVEGQLVDQWEDSRRIWLPLQLALSPEDHDEQREIDALVERVLGRQFTEDNDVAYVTGGDLQVEFARSILLARDYHVLWVHDFAGTRPDGTVDVVGFRQVADVYFPALTQAVARYDSTGRFPSYLVFLDQNYYEANRGRVWMTILEDPLGARIALPAGAARDSLAAHLRARQAALRDAVAASRRLQADAARAGGARWLHRFVKVHVNITQPSDFTFRSHRILPPMPFLPDNVMRDHRKMAFYDVSEADPWRGALILAGAGVGEHYASPTWQDRAILLRGPAALEARAAARRLLTLNGFQAREIPEALRESPPVARVATGPGLVVDSAAGVLARDVDTLAVRGGARALMAHNEPGFGRKQSSVVRAMLYSLAPPGSLIVVPDPLWLGAEWAGMLTGAALRGCRVYVVAPALANAPASELPVMSGSQDVLLRLLQVRQEFGDAIHSVGGELRIGLFTAEEDVNDVVRQTRETLVGLERAPWLREIFPFDTATLGALDSMATALERGGYKARSLGTDLEPRHVQLHQKTQLVASADVVARLARLPEWREVFLQTMLARAHQSEAAIDPRGIEAIRSARLQPAESLFRDATADPHIGGARQTLHFTIGTQNQDSRGLMLDGEATVVLSGLPAGLGLVDFFTLMARSTWIETPAQLDALLPPVTGWMQRIGRRIRFVL